MHGNATARNDELDNDAYLLQCLDRLSNATKNGIEVRAVYCEKCLQPFFDKDFKQILSNTRKCVHCEHQQVVGSNLACNPLAWYTRPVVADVTINATNIQKIDDVLKQKFQEKYEDIKQQCSSVGGIDKCIKYFLQCTNNKQKMQQSFCTKCGSQQLTSKPYSVFGCKNCGGKMYINGKRCCNPLANLLSNELLQLALSGLPNFKIGTTNISNVNSIENCTLRTFIRDGKKGKYSS